MCVDYTTQKEKIQKNRKAHVEKKRREKERLQQEIDDKRNTAETILSNVKMLGLVPVPYPYPVIEPLENLSFILVAFLNDDPTVELKNLKLGKHTKA